MRTLVLTGGTGGLGTAVTEHLSRDYRCILLYHSTPPENHEGIRADLSDESSVREAFGRVGEIYGLVHLAGGFAPGNVAETSLATWSKMLALNTTAAFLAAREALAHLTRPGRLVFVSSEATLARTPGTAAYTVSKSALDALVEVLAAEHRGTGITANAVLPAAMATPAMLESMPESELVPLSNVVDAIAFLLSDAAAAITGSRLPIRR